MNINDNLIEIDKNKIKKIYNFIFNLIVNNQQSPLMIQAVMEKDQIVSIGIYIFLPSI